MSDLTELDESIEEAMKGAEESQEDEASLGQEQEAHESEEVASDEIEELLSPESWTDEAKAAFSSLAGMEGAHPHVKAILDQYQSEIGQYSQIQKHWPQVQQTLGEYQQFIQALTPYQEFFNRTGLNATSAIGTAVHWIQEFERDKGAAFKRLMQEYGLSAQDLSSDDEPFLTDQDRTYLQKISDLERQNATIQQQWQMHSQQQQQQAFLTEIRKLEGMQNEDGTAKYPWLSPSSKHHQQYYSALVQVASSGLVQTWEQAADYAIQFVPGIKAESDAAAMKRQNAERQKAAEKARAASRRVSGKSVSGESEASASGNLDDDIDAAIKQQQEAA